MPQGKPPVGRTRSLEVSVAGGRGWGGGDVKVKVTVSAVSARCVVLLWSFCTMDDYELCIHDISSWQSTAFHRVSRFIKFCPITVASSPAIRSLV